MNSGELEAREMKTRSLFLFIPGAITAILVLILVFGIALLFFSIFLDGLVFLDA